MALKKHPFGMIFHPIFIFFTIMILLQSIQNARISVPLVRSALPMHHYNVTSPLPRQVNPLCPVKTCHTGVLPTYCPCNLRHSCFSNGNVTAGCMDSLCQVLPARDQNLCRFFNTGTLKKTLKRVARSRCWLCLSF